MVTIRYRGERHTVRKVAEMERYGETYIEVELGFGTKWLHKSAIVQTAKTA